MPGGVGVGWRILLLVSFRETQGVSRLRQNHGLVYSVSERITVCNESVSKAYNSRPTRSLSPEEVLVVSITLVTETLPSFYTLTFHSRSWIPTSPSVLQPNTHPLKVVFSSSWIADLGKRIGINCGGNFLPEEFMIYSLIMLAIKIWLAENSYF